MAEVTNNTAVPAVTTERFAARNVVLPESVRAAYCRKGHYHGIKPLKLASGRLLWPDVVVVAEGEVAA